MCSHPLLPAIVSPAQDHQAFGRSLVHSRTMDCVQSQINDAIAYWNIPRIITYPMTPYMTLRLQLEIYPPPPFVRPRVIWDMGTKLLQGGGGFGGGSKENEEVYEKQPKSTQTSTIQDKRNKLIVYNATNTSNGLSAVMGGKSGATFEITNYTILPPGEKQPVTLKLKPNNGTDCYLSCTSRRELTLETVNGTLDEIQGDTIRFLFLRKREKVKASFESVVCPGMYICTTTEQRSTVSLSPNTDQTKITDFSVNSEMFVPSLKPSNNGNFTGSGIIVVGDRIAVYVPKKYLEILARQSMYERFTSRSILLAELV